MRNLLIVGICAAGIIQVANAPLNIVPGSMLKTSSGAGGGSNKIQEYYDWRYDPDGKDENGKPYPKLEINGELNEKSFSNNRYLSVSIPGSALQILFEFKSGLMNFGYEVNVKGFSINSYSGFKVDDWKKVLAQITNVWQNDLNKKIGKDYTSKTLTKLKEQLVKSMELKKPLFKDQNQRDMYNKAIQELITDFKKLP